MHICCAVCALFPVRHLEAKGIGIRGLWFNPNIHPEDEYRKRLDAVERLEGLWGLEMEYEDRYGLEEFRRRVSGERGVRCRACYSMRLEQTALTARKMGLEGFTTSLLVSPYQNFDLVVETGTRLEKEHSIRFYREDLRPGWPEGRRLSRELGLYRQYYCGCLYSKEERDRERKALAGRKPA